MYRGNTVTPISCSVLYQPIHWDELQISSKYEKKIERSYQKKKKKEKMYREIYF